MIETNVMNKIEVAEYLKLSIASIDRLMKSDKFPYVKLGDTKKASVRFVKESVDKWLRLKYKGFN